MDTLGEDLEEVIDESVRSRKRPPSSFPLADAGPRDGVVAGTGRVRRVRRRRDLSTAYMQAYPRHPGPAPPAPVPAAPSSLDAEHFTPTCITDGTRCLARVWNEGQGGQCACPPDNGSDVDVRRRHRAPAQQSRGLVTGPIPQGKLDAFRRPAGVPPRAPDPDSIPEPPASSENDGMKTTTQALGQNHPF